MRSSQPSIPRRLLVACALLLSGCDDRASGTGGGLPPHADVPVAVVTEVQNPPPPRLPGSPPVAPPRDNAPAANTVNIWPRKMPRDAVTGHVMSPPAKVARQPRLIAWYIIGNSDTNVANRMIGGNIKKNGWADFVNTRVEPAIKLGFDAIQLHNPGGTKPAEEMQSDQFIDAKEEGLDWISRGFVDAWRPVTQRLPVIAYLGALPHNERLQTFLKRGDRSRFLQTIVDSYKLPLDAKMDIAFDAMHYVKPDSWEVQVLQLFNAMGVTTYIEPVPHVSDVTLYDANYQIMNRTLERALSNGEPWLPALDQLGGERIILLAEPPVGQTWETINEWFPAFLQHWTAQGWSVAFGPDICMKYNRRPHDLARPGARLP